MTITETTSTFEIEIRAQRALNQGHTFRFIGANSTRVQIQYVAGGGMCSVETRTAAGERLFGKTSIDTAAILRHFLAEVREVAEDAVAGSPYNAGVIASIKVLDEQIAALDSDDIDTPPAARQLRIARRSLRDLLDTEVGA